MSNFIKTKGKWVLTLSLVLVMVLGGVGTVSAAEFPKGETIPASQTIDDDVFITGDNVVVDGTVNGLLMAAGQTVIINGTVNGDALLFGETIVVSDDAVIDGNLFTGAAEIKVNGTVTGSVFGGSSSMKVGSGAEVARNFFYGGFSLTTDEGSSIGTDLYTGAYQVLLSGTVNRDANVGAAAVELNGTVGRNATFDLGEVDEADQSAEWMNYNPWISKYVDTVVQSGLTISDAASIGGKVTYTSSVDETSLLEDVTSGAVVYRTPVPYTEPEETRDYSGQVQPFSRNSWMRHSVWGTGLSVVRSLIKLFVLGALALWLLKKPFMKLVDAAYQEPLKAIGWGFVVIAVGFLAMFIVPLVFVLVGVVIGVLSLGGLLFVWFGLVGTTLALAVLIFFFAVFTLSKVLASYMLGKWLMKVLFKQEEEKAWLNLLIGVFLYVVIRAIPVIGWVAGLTATLIGTGAFWLALTKKKAV